MKKYAVVLVLLMSLMFVGTVFAATSYPWQNHAAPYDFLFGNHIDTHQQSQLMGKNKLEGFFYIMFTGKEMNGVPEAMQGDCAAAPDDCTVGWKLNGVARQAKLVAKPEEGYPVWCIDPADMPRQPGYSHFHWSGSPEHAGHLQVGNTYNGYLMKLTAREKFYFMHHGGNLVTPGIDTVTHANVVTDCAN